MKELSIEEKAKAYDEAIERAVKLKENPKAIFFEEKNVHVSDYIFPELKESEDEKIRKEIHIYLDWLDGRKDYAPRGEYTIKDMIAWLEKQSEQILANSAKTCKNPAWSEEDDDYYDAIIAKLEVTQEDAALTNNQMEFLKSLKDRYTWNPSEEQIKVCKEVYADVLSAKGFDVGAINSELNRLEEQLKKLKGECWDGGKLVNTRILKKRKE